MKLTTYLTMFVLTVFSLTFSGCGEKIVYVPKYTNVPVYCEAPKVKCNYKDLNNTETLLEMIRCSKQKDAALEVCRAPDGYEYPKDFNVSITFKK